MKTKPGMSSLNEDDVRRIARDEMSNVLDKFYGTLADRLLRKFKYLPQATDTEPPANQATSEVPAAEDNVPPWVERRKRPEPRQYKEPTPCKDNT